MRQKRKHQFSIARPKKALFSQILVIALLVGLQTAVTSPVWGELFNTRFDFFAGRYYPRSVASGDFDGDGDLDLAVANGQYGFVGNVSIHLGNDDGTFQSATNYAVGDTPNTIAIGDLNGDSVLDLAVTNNRDDYVSVLLGNGNGTFQTETKHDCGEYATLYRPTNNVLPLSQK